MTGVTVVGVRGQLVAVEAHVGRGLPSLTLTGLPGAGVQDARDRIRPAVESVGLEWPQRRVVVNLSPGTLRKEGPGLDCRSRWGCSPESGKRRKPCQHLGVLVRRYEGTDADRVREIHAQAFRRPDAPDAVPREVALFDALVEADDVIPQLSLVAVRDGDLVGHVVCSRATVEARAVAALGPIAVDPRNQRQGAGQAMMHAVLSAADALDVPLVGLLGSPEYYSRFGFALAETFGIESPYPELSDHFQVRTLAGYDSSITGRFRYSRAFDLV